MFLAVGETQGTRNTQKRASSNNLFLSSSEARTGGKDTETLRRAGCEAARKNLTRSCGGAEDVHKRKTHALVRKVLKISLCSLRSLRLKFGELRSRSEEVIGCGEVRTRVAGQGGVKPPHSPTQAHSWGVTLAPLLPTPYCSPPPNAL